MEYTYRGIALNRFPRLHQPNQPPPGKGGDDPRGPDHEAYGNGRPQQIVRFVMPGLHEDHISGGVERQEQGIGHHDGQGQAKPGDIEAQRLRDADIDGRHNSGHGGGGRPYEVAEDAESDQQHQQPEVGDVLQAQRDERHLDNDFHGLGLCQAIGQGGDPADVDEEFPWQRVLRIPPFQHADRTRQKDQRRDDEGNHRGVQMMELIGSPQNYCEHEEGNGPFFRSGHRPQCRQVLVDPLDAAGDLLHLRWEHFGHEPTHQE